MKKLYFFFLISSLIIAFFQAGLDLISSDIQRFFTTGILSGIIFLLEGIFLGVLTKKFLFPFCIAFSGVVYLSIFMQLRINNSWPLLIFYSLFVIQFFRIFDILGFLSYRKFQKIKNRKVKKITETQINFKILCLIFTLLLLLLIFFSGILANWSGLIFMPVFFLLIVLGIAQLLSLIKDIQNSKK